MLFTCAQYFSNTRSSFYVQTIVFIRPMQTAMKGLYQAGIALNYVWFQWVKYPLSGLCVVSVGSIFSFLCNDL